MAITTFTRITAKDAAANLLDESAPAGKAFIGTINDAVAQKACQRVHYGREVEDQGNYWVFAEWDSVEDRIAYVKSEAFQSVSKGLFQFVDGTKTVSKHFTLSSKLASPASVFGADGLGAIEVLSLHFPGDISDTDKAEADRLWLEFQTHGLETSKEYKGTAGGWSVEADVPNIGGGSGEGKAICLVIGWTSVQAHVDNRKTEAFAKVEPLLVEKMPGRNGLMVCHVKTTTKQ